MVERDRFPTEWSLPVQSSTGPEQESLRPRTDVPEAEDDSETQLSKELAPVPALYIGRTAIETPPPASNVYLGPEEYLG